MSNSLHRPLVLLIAVLTIAQTNILNKIVSESNAAQHDIPILQGMATDRNNFFHLAIVPNQVVTTDSFEVQVISESVDPNSPNIAPIVTDSFGSSHVMRLKTLKWPGTSDNSIKIYSAIIPLVKNSINNIDVTLENKHIGFFVWNKQALEVRTAHNSHELSNIIRAAITNPAIDIVEIAFNENDLGGILNALGNNIQGRRSSWLTLRAKEGYKVAWHRDSGVEISRPKIDFLHLNKIVFGSDTSDGGGGQLYVERNHHVWLSEIEFRAKYKSSWPKNKRMTSKFLPDVRVFNNEGQKVYYTDCLWDGTASNSATSSAELARDLRFFSHRGDFNNFGKVFINAIAKDAVSVRNYADSDYLHNDGFQIWGEADNIVFKGFKVVSENARTELQPFHFSRTYSPRYSYILVDSLQIEGADRIVQTAQLAGRISYSRISNIMFSSQPLSIRQDFNEPNGAFSADHVYVANASVRLVEYVSPSYGRNYKNETNRPLNVASDLNALSTLSGAVFINIFVTPLR